MKKVYILTMIFLAVLFYWQPGNNVLAASTSDGLVYEIKGDEVTITGYTGTNPEVTIPDMIEGGKVTEIGLNAFARNKVITSVILPKYLKTIGRCAFEFTNLEEVIIPDSCTYIRTSAFCACVKLKNIVIPKDVEFEYLDKNNLVFDGVERNIFKAYIVPGSAAEKYFDTYESNFTYYYQEEYVPNKISFEKSEITINVDEEIQMPKLNIEPENSVKLCKGTIEYAVKGYAAIKDPTTIKFTKEEEIELIATLSGEHIEKPISASMKINVVEKRKLVEKVELYKNNALLGKEMTVNVGDTIVIEPRVTPVEDTDYTSKWSIWNTNYENDLSAITYKEKNGNMEITADYTGHVDVSFVATDNFKLNSRKVGQVRIWIKEPETEEKYIKFSQSDVKIKENETLQLTVETNSDSGVIFESLDTTVATVDSRGVVKAIKGGPSEFATIKASIDEGAVAYCNVWVAELEKYIKLNKTQVKLNNNETFRLTADSNTKGGIHYESSDTSVAMVDRYGLIKAVGTGKTTITVSISEGKKAVCYVEVVDGSYIKLNKTSETMYKGQTLKLSSTFNSLNEVEYTSSDSDIAVVDEKGNVKAVGTGKVTITASISEGKKAYCKITVKNNKVKLNATKFNMQKGKTVTALTVKSKSIKDDKIKSVKSSNSKVLKVQYSKGKIVLRAVKPSSKYITVTVTMKSGAKASSKVKVVKGTVRTSKLTLSEKKLTLKKGKKETLTVSRNPIGSSDKLTWKSSNKKIATVSSKGKITAKKKGSCTITVRSASGKTAKCRVTVK